MAGDRPILVALKNTPASLRGLEVALGLASATKKRSVRVVHVIVVERRLPLDAPLPDQERAAEALLERAEQLIPLERKRLEIARALATRPRLLLLDEIIAGLNPTEAGQMMDTIRTINARGVTVLLIEHVMKAVMGLSHRVIVLHHGEKIAEGEPAAVAADEDVVRAYLGMAF